MKKLKLESIRVESFETSEIPTRTGTVEAHAITPACPATLSCPGTCSPSCNVTACASCESAPWCC